MPWDFGPHTPPFVFLAFSLLLLHHPSLIYFSSLDSGAADNEKNRAILPSLSPLNFAHLSSATIRLEHTPKPDPNTAAMNYVVEDDNFHTRTRIEVVSKSKQPGPYRTARQEILALSGGFNPVRFALAWFLPPFLFNHCKCFSSFPPLL